MLSNAQRTELFMMCLTKKQQLLLPAKQQNICYKENNNIYFIILKWHQLWASLPQQKWSCLPISCHKQVNRKSFSYKSLPMKVVALVFITTDLIVVICLDIIFISENVKFGTQFTYSK